MSSDEKKAFERQRHAQRALVLRRADERGKVEGLVVPGLEERMDVVRALGERPA
jgi:predicted HD phosphohydrolase